MNNIVQPIKKKNIYILGTKLLEGLVSYHVIYLLVVGEKLLFALLTLFNHSAKCFGCPETQNSAPGLRGPITEPGGGGEGARVGAEEEGKVLEGEYWMGK